MKSKMSVILLMAFLVLGVSLIVHGPRNVLAQPIELRLATFAPQGEGDLAVGIPWYADELEKRTNGRVKIKIFWSGSLAKSLELPRAVRSGMADMATVIESYHPELFPYSSSAGQAALILAGADLGDWRIPYRKLMDQFPEVRDAYKKQNQKMLVFWENDRISIISNRPIRNFAEAKGIKIRTSGEYVPRMFKAGGFNPISIPAAEAYDAAGRSMVEAIHSYPDTALKYRFYEVCKYWTETPIFGTHISYILTINLDTWNKLPPDVQNVMVKLGDELTDAFPDITRQFRDKFQKTFKEVGGTSFTFSEGEMKEWKSRIQKDNMEYYLQKMEAKGAPRVREIVYRFAELMNYKWQ